MRTLQMREQAAQLEFDCRRAKQIGEPANKKILCENSVDTSRSGLVTREK